MLTLLTFLEFLGFNAMLWNFQGVQCVDKHVEQDDGRKGGGWEAKLQGRI